MPHDTETKLSDDGGDLSTPTLLEILHAPHVSKEARENAIELIYRRYSPEILRFIQSEIKVKEDIWDIHSEVWKCAFEHLRRFVWQTEAKTADPLKSWLLTTTHHKLQEHWRQYPGDPIELIDAHLAYFDTYDTYDSFASEYAALQPRPLQDRMDWLLTEAQRSLSPLEQKVILLTYYNGKNSREIGELLKITPENARICRHRAIKKLREFFAQRTVADSVEVYATQEAAMQTEDSKLLEEIGELLALHYEDWQVQDPKGAEVAFGRYLRSVRQLRQLTVAEVAAQAQVAESELLAYEQGLIPKRCIKARALTALAQTLDEEIDTFLLLLEANMVDKAVPTASAPLPSAAPPAKRAQGFFSRSGHASRHKVDSATGASASYGRKGVLEPQMGIAAKIEPTKPMRTTGVTDKPSLWQVLGDPRWQVKIYRIWTLVVTLLLCFCLQVQAFYPNWVWQIDPDPASAATVNQVQATARDHSTVAATMPQGAISQDEATAKPPAAQVANPDKASTRLPLPPSMDTLWRFVQPQPGNAALLREFSARPVSIGKSWEILPLTLPVEKTPLPLVHVVGDGEGPTCISNQYYKAEKFYPFLCLYQFGNLQCAGSLHPGNLIEIPVFADFQIEDPQVNQALAQLPPTLLDDFKAISKDTIYTNQTERLRGVDYFCQAGDYKNYGEPLVLAGRIKDPSQRISGWSSTKG